METYEKTPEENREVLSKRNDVYTKLKLLSYIQLTLSAVSIAVGIVTIVYAAANPHFPWIAGAPIYSPVMVIIGAVFTLLMIQESTNDVSSGKYQRYLGVMSSMAWSGHSLLIMSFSWGVVGAVHCRSTELKTLENCMPHNNELFILSILAAILGITLSGTCIVAGCLYARNRKTLGCQRQKTKCCSP